MDPDVRVIDFEEAEYRHGYYDGWSMAISTMQSLLLGEKRTPEEICRLCAEQRQMLQSWSHEDSYEPEPVPPGLRRQVLV